jgi:anti-anti-sigma factor
MQTFVSQNGDVTVVKVSGRLDIDQAGTFRQACLNRLSAKKVIFNLEELTFVGSTGIQSFFQTVQELHLRAPYGVRIVGLHHDFQRVLKLRSELVTPPCLLQMADAFTSFQFDQAVDESQDSEASRTS